MDENYVCWKCGASIQDWPLPLSRLAECTKCRSDLHVCRTCKFYDDRVAKFCREPIAEEIKEKTRANFCGYFVLRPDAFDNRGQQAATAARAALTSLFSDTPASTTEPAPNNPTDARRQLDALFGKAKDDTKKE